MGFEGFFWFGAGHRHTASMFTAPSYHSGNPFRPLGGWSAFHKDQRKRQAKAQAKRRRRAAR